MRSSGVWGQRPQQAGHVDCVGTDALLALLALIGKCDNMTKI